MIRLLRVLAGLVLVALVLVVAVVALLWSQGRGKLNRVVDRRVPAFAALTDSAAIARGSHLAEIACTACHGADENLPLSGLDTAFIDAPALAVLHPANLTPGGVLADRYADDGKLARAIREGIDAEGQPLVLMPAHAFHGMSDRDLGSLIGYLRSQPAVSHATAPRRVGPIGAILLATNQIPTSMQPPVDAVAHVEEAPTAEYGRYLTPIYGCTECHGANLKGLEPNPNGPPAGPDLVQVAHRYPVETFERAVRHGEGTNGNPLASTMPWRIFSRLHDVEVQAIYAYLKTLN
jgi:mono/diheme cytochrome c family protein